MSTKEEIVRLFNQAISFSAPGLPDGALHTRNIQEAARREAIENSEIILTRDDMTPGMRASCVQPQQSVLAQWRAKRDLYLNAVAPHWAEIDEQDSPATKKQKIDKEIENQIADVRRQANEDTRYSAALKEKDEATRQYEKLSDRHRRQPKTFSTAFYILLLFGVGAVEWLINSSTFQANWGVPALAAGFTILVAITVAMASHFHGTFLRQRDYWFGDFVDPRKKFWELLIVFLMALAIGAILFWIGYERYEWGMRELQKIGQVGGGDLLSERLSTGFRIDVKQKVFHSLIGNTLVWVVGVGVAYITHDPDPEFPRAKKRMDRAQRSYLKLHRPIEAKIKVLEAERKRRLDELANISSSEGEFYRDLRQQKERIEAHEASILKSVVAQAKASIDDYQNFLCAEAIAKIRPSR